MRYSLQAKAVGDKGWTDIEGYDDRIACDRQAHFLALQEGLSQQMYEGRVGGKIEYTRVIDTQRDGGAHLVSQYASKT